MASFKVNILSPSKVLEKNLEVESMIIPTESGYINVLPEHTHLVTKLSTGILTLKTSNGVKEFSSTSGVCKIQHDQVTFLSTTCEKAENINLPRAEKALKIAKEKLAERDSLNTDDLLKFSRKLDRAEIRIKLALKSSKK